MCNFLHDPLMLYMVEVPPHWLQLRRVCLTIPFRINHLLETQPSPEQKNDRFTHPDLPRSTQICNEQSFILFELVVLTFQHYLSILHVPHITKSPPLTWVDYDILWSGKISIWSHVKPYYTVEGPARGHNQCYICNIPTRLLWALSEFDEIALNYKAVCISKMFKDFVSASMRTEHSQG